MKLENLLLELSGEEIYKKYYSNISERTFKKLVGFDPQSIFDNSGNILKVGRFSKLIIDLYLHKDLFPEDLPKAKEYLSYIYKYSIPVYVNKINGLEDLYDLVKPYFVKNTKNLDNVLKSLPDNEYKLLYDGSTWLIFTPLTERASCYLGIGTQWCTTWGNNSLNPNYRDRTNYFKTYNPKGPLYIIINKLNEEDKYQFHFGSHQFKNSADKEIDTGDFLSKNKEIKNFFFPSFIGEVDQNELTSEFDKIKILNSEDTVVLLKKYLDLDKNTNQLALAFFEMVNKKINELPENVFIDEKVEELSANSDKIMVTFVNIDYYYTKSGEVKDVLTAYQHDKRDNDYIYNSIHQAIYGHEHWIDEHLVGVFKQFYEKNSNELKIKVGIFNYEQLEKMFLDRFLKNEKVLESFTDRTVSLTSPNYDSALTDHINDIKKYIDFDDAYRRKKITLNFVYFIVFLIKSNVTKIDENLSEIIDNYINFYNIETEYEGINDFEYDYPDYGDPDFAYVIDDFFYNLGEEDDEDDEDREEFREECERLRTKLTYVLSRLFNNSSKFENEHTFVSVDLLTVSCRDKSVNIEFKNKDTGKTYKGPVKIDNLSNYVTNYQLFENLITFKKNIL